MTATPVTHAKRKPLLLLASGVFITLACVYGIWWYFIGSKFEQTDNAYVRGNQVQITPQVPGTVIAIEADNTQVVKAGQPLVRLDPADTQIALSQAEAHLAQTLRQVRTLYVQNDALAADVNVSQAALVRARTDMDKARSDLTRRQTLAKSGGVSGEELLHAQTTFQAAEASVTQAQAALASTQARLQTNRALTEGTSISTHPDVQQAIEKLRNAWLAHSRTILPAPVSGVVDQRMVQVGQHVVPGLKLMQVVPLEQIWVEANFKEGQLRRMRTGQPVKLTADIYGNSVTYHGTIVGLGTGTGSAMSLLPAQNATGNWIKIVQRVPVRVALDPEEVARNPLIIGLSMEAEVDISQPGNAELSQTATPPILSTEAFTPDTHEVDALIARIIQENTPQ